MLLATASGLFGVMLVTFVLAIFTVFRNYVRQRFNRDEPDQTPAKLLGLMPRQLQPSEVVRWRQDWASLSLHPMSLCGDRAITQGVSM